MDTITLLKSLPGVYLAKRWTSDGIAGYDKARYVYVREADVSCIYSLATVLKGVEPQSNVCAIRGMKVSLEDAQAMGTLPDLSGGEPLPAVKKASDGGDVFLRRKGIFKDAPHHWVCLDVDSFRPVKTAGDLLSKPENCVAEFLQALPAPFQTATCYWQLSNSHGAPGNEGILKVHIWFWLSVARTGAELTAWAKAEKLVGLVDITLFRPVQVHYTAAPVVDDGVVCPVVQRHGVLPGLMGDAVDLEITPAMLAAVVVDREDGGLWDDGEAPADPGSKPGLVGAFCRAYGTLADVMAQEWADDLSFTPDGGSDRRWTWGGGGGAVGGAWVVDGPNGGQWVGNSHATDPCAGRLVNLYDLVRCHRFGALDDAIPDEDRWVADVDVKARPSEAAMRAWCRTLPEVRAELDAAEAEAERVSLDAMAAGDVSSTDTLEDGDDGDDGVMDGVWFDRMVLKTRAKLIGAGVAEEDIAGLIRVPQMRAAWASSFFRASSGRLYLLNRAGVLVNFIQADWPAQVQEAFGRFLDKHTLPGIAASIVAARGPATGKNTVSEVKKELIGIAVGTWSAYVKAYRQRETLAIEVDMFRDGSSITMPNPDMARITYAHTEFEVEPATAGADIEALVLADYREHVPELDEIVDFLVYARFASDRRKAFCLWKALAGWGKGLLWNAVLGRDGMGLVTEMSMKEVESAMEGKPSGLSASDFHGKWVLWTDEFRAPKAEIKQLNSAIFISPKGMPRIEVKLYAKVMTTAEEIPSLMGEHGTEDQFASRMMFYRHDGSDDQGAINIEARPVYQQVTSVEYIKVLRRWFAARLNDRVAEMRALGRDGSAKVANAGLAEMHTRRGIAVGKKTLNQHVPEMAAELEALIKDWARAKCPVDGVMDTEGTGYLDTLPGPLKSALGMNVRTLVGARNVADIDERSEAWVTVKHATHVVKAWIDTTIDPSERVSVRHKAGEIAEAIGEEPYTKPYRLWLKDKSEVKQRGLLIHLWDAAERKRRKLIPDEGGNILNFPT